MPALVATPHEAQKTVLDQTLRSKRQGVNVARNFTKMLAEPPRTAAIRISRAYRRKSRQTQKNDNARPPRIRHRASMPVHGIFTRPRPIAEMEGSTG